MLSYLLVTHTGFSGASQEHYAFAGLFFTFPIPISLQVRQGISTSPDIRIWERYDQSRTFEQGDGTTFALSLAG
jgi:hypothetical protein